MLSVLEKFIPSIPWIFKALRSRLLTPNMLLRLPQQFLLPGGQLAAGDETQINSVPINEFSVLKVRLGRPDCVLFSKLDSNIDRVPLADGEVLFVPTNLALHKYILYYNEIYLAMDMDHFTDPNGIINSKYFKVTPAWGHAMAYRSNHPNIAYGDLFYGFWPISPYVSIKVSKEAHTQVGYLDIPSFSGPKEWLKLLKAEKGELFETEFFEYFKIGLTFSRELHDADYFNAEQLVLTSASSGSAQVIAMSTKEINPALPIVGITSQRNFEQTSQLPFYDRVVTYENLEAIDNNRPSIFFDVLGNKEIAKRCFTHLELNRWWFYGQGSQRLLPQFLVKNSKGSFYTNLVDSFCYAKDKGILDSEITEFSKGLIEKHNLKKLWNSDSRIVSTNQELFDHYMALVSDQKHYGRAVYQSPLYQP